VIDSGPVTYGTDRGDWDIEAVGPTRAPLLPLTTTQPQGPSFTIKGGEVRWDQWSFHIRADMRRGLVVSQARYADQGRERSVMYQGCSELFVPYMAPDERWNYTAYFDLGTFPGIFDGVTGSLEPGIDCPAHGVMVDGIVSGWKGEPRRKPRVACLYERANGEPIWRHGVQYGVADGRVRRDLVLRMITHAGNYDYIFDWIFTQDGVIRVNVGATGIVQVVGDAIAAAGAATSMAATSPEPGGGEPQLPWRSGSTSTDGPANSLVVERLKTEKCCGQPAPEHLEGGVERGRVEQEGQLMSMMRAARLAVREPGGEGRPATRWPTRWRWTTARCR
jgi:primary-amine oxidase